MLKSMKKKMMLLGAATLMGVTMVALPCFASSIQIQLDGKVLKTEVAPLQEKGTTLVPIRVISENLGANVKFDPDTKKITIVKEGKEIVLTLGQNKALVNKQEVAMEKAPCIKDKATMVPLRFVGEQLNCKVGWDKDAQVVTIVSDGVKDNKDATDVNDNKQLPVATLKIKDYGTITLELYPKMAPNTVNNFIELANSGFYDGLTFHRIIATFMIQGGDPQGTGAGGPGYDIKGEFASNGFTQNTLSHTKGVISMARTAMPDTAGSQFFIMSGDATYLDGQYAAFGKVTSGLDLIDKIQSVETDSQDKPLKPVVIESLRVNTQGITYEKPVKVAQK